MFYKSTASLYTRGRNANEVASYSLITTFKCKVQPMKPWNGFDWATMYNTETMFT